MKTKLFLGLCMFMVLASCIKDYHGGNGGKIVLTGDNYLYEGDLYRIYLEQEIEKLDGFIQELEDIIANNQADQSTLDQLGEATKKREDFKSQIAGIISLEEVERSIPRPRPPCPKPRNCDFTSFEYVLAGNTVKEITIKILDKGGKVIGGGTIDELSPLPDTKDLIKFSNLKIDPYEGPISIAVEVFDETSNDRSYFLTE